MKKIYLFMLITAVVNTSIAQIISQYVETNSGTTPKGIEIWNNTGSTLDFSTNNLIIKKGVNGSSPSTDYTLSSGTLSSGLVIVIGTSDMEATAISNGATFYLKPFTFNGDDAIEVWYGVTKTDVFGVPGVDPGSAWTGNGVSTANQNIQIKAGLTSGDTDGWSDPSIRFKTVSTNPVGAGGLAGIGIAPINLWKTSASTTDWATGSNWEDGIVPATVVNVTIPTGASNYPIISGDAATPSECNNLTIESGASLSIPVDKALTVSGTITNSAGNSGIVVQSSSSGDGSLIFSSGTPSGTVERYIAAYSGASDGFHMLSSPVNNMVIAGSDFVPGTSEPNRDDLYGWDEVSNEWKNYKIGGNNITNFVNGAGYLVAYESTATKDFTGTLNKDDVSKSGLTYTDASGRQGWHLLGNPYQSALYWNKTAWGLTNVDATAKIWKESTSSYIDIAASTGIIPAMQGFFVHANAATGSLTIDATDRTHNAQDWYKNTEVNKLVLTAYDTEGGTAQECIVKVVDDATNQFDSDYDSRFLPGYAPQFYVKMDGIELSTTAFPELTSEMIIPMSFIKNNSTEYNIEVIGVNEIEHQEHVYLTDLKTNTTQLLNENPSYYFTAEDGDVEERFVVHFSALSVNENDFSENVKAFYSNDNIEIRTNKPISAEINVYSVSGSLINTFNLDGESSASINIGDYKGLAIVSVISDGHTFNNKVIVW